MVRCKECSRAMHRSCMHRDVCGDCHRDEMIEKCLGERNDEILVKWRNESYGCIEWVPMTWIQFKYPEVYKDYLTSDRCHSVDKEEFSVERVLDVIWHDRRQPNHVKLLYKNMKQEEGKPTNCCLLKVLFILFCLAVWEAPPTENQAYEEALEIYKKNHMNTEAQ